MNSNFKYSLFLFVIVISISLFFRLKIIHELPLGIKANEYGLTGFDDEPAHFNYTKYILEHNALPILENKITDPDALEINEFEYHQPPLYYTAVAVAANTLSISESKTILLLGRYLNLFLTLISIYVFYLIFTQYGWNNFKIFSAISIFLLLGSSVYQMTVFGNDTLSWFLFWTIFLFLLRGVRKNWTTLIFLFTLLHYTKSSVLVLYPLLFFAAYQDLRINKIDKTSFYKYSLILILPFVFAFPWYLRNYNVYGSFFSISTITGESWYFVKSLNDSIVKILHMPYTFLFRMHFNPPKPILSWFNIIPNLWLVGAGLLASIHVFRISKESLNIKLLNLLLFSVLGAYLYYAIPTGYTEGRFLFPTLPAILFFMTDLIYNKTITAKISETTLQLLIILVFLPSYLIGFFW